MEPTDNVDMMKTLIRKSSSHLVTLVFSLLSLNCTGSSNDSGAGATDPIPLTTVVAKSGRSLGIDIVNESAGSTFTQNAALAKSIGAEYFILDLTWKYVEPIGSAANCTPGSYSDSLGLLSSFNSVLPALGLKMTLNFSLSTTNIWSLPTAHSSSTFLLDPSLPGTQADIDRIACRYVNALNYVLTNLPNVTLVSLQIGNEIDYLSEAAHYNFWANYWRFYAAASSYARTVRTTSVTTALPVGVTASLAGLTGEKGETIRLGLDALNQVSDFVGANYYPFEAGGSQAKVDMIATKLNALFAAAGARTVHLQEFGCQSGTVSGSSSTLQAKCFNELFKVWDANPLKLTHANILRMNDLSHAQATSTASQYTTPAAPGADFIDYLETLGLKTYAGNEKPALTYLKDQLKLRGWY